MRSLLLWEIESWHSIARRGGGFPAAEGDERSDRSRGAAADGSNAPGFLVPGHGAEVAAWVAAVREGEESPVPFDEAVGATRTTFAMLESLRTGRAVDPTA